MDGSPPLAWIALVITLAAAGALLLAGTIGRVRGEDLGRTARAGRDGWRTIELPADPMDGATITRRYGGSFRTATAAFEVDAALLGEAHWAATSTDYVPGQWRLVDFLAAFLLVPVLAGFVVLAYMFAVRPPGELLVVYEYRPAPDRRPVSPGERLRRLAELRDIGIVTEGEYESRRAELITRI